MQTNIGTLICEKGITSDVGKKRQSMFIYDIDEGGRSWKRPIFSLITSYFKI